MRLDVCCAQEESDKEPAVTAALIYAIEWQFHGISWGFHGMELNSMGFHGNSIGLDSVGISWALSGI